jgi:hypothetical protein
MLRPTVSWSVSLDVVYTYGSYDQYVTTDGQLVSLSRCRLHIWGLWSVCYDRRSVGQSLSMSCTRVGPMIRFLLRSECCWLLISDTYPDCVCSLDRLLGLASGVILGSESHSTQDHVLLHQTWDSPRNRVTRLFHQVLGGVFPWSWNYITDGQSTSLSFMSGTHLSPVNTSH